MKRTFAIALGLLMGSIVLPSAAQESGFWVIVGSTLNPDNDSVDEANDDVNDRLEDCGEEAFSDWSFKWSTFTPGYTASVLGPYSTRSKANAARRDVLDCIPDAYVKRATYAGD